ARVDRSRRLTRDRYRGGRDQLRPEQDRHDAARAAAGDHVSIASTTGRAGRATATLPIAGAPGAVAALTWVLAGSLAALVPAGLDLNPFDSLERLIPWLIGVAAVIVVSAVGFRNRKPWLYGLTVGLFAAFTVLVLRAALHGTPYAYEAEFGDTGRLSAM